MSSTIVYDPAGSGSFTNGPTLDTPRKQHTATLLTSGPNAGKVLVVGGRKKSGSGYVTLATYQICGAAAPMGPITCTPSATGIAARYAHAAVALGPTGSKVLIVGGTNGSSDLASAELYDSATGTWAVSGTLGVLSPARSDLTLSELPNGRALAVGGSFNGMAKKDADAYTPPIAAMADMFTPRAGHTATPLRDAAGNITGILVTGGADDDADEDDALDSRGDLRHAVADRATPFQPSPACAITRGSFLLAAMFSVDNRRRPPGGAAPDSAVTSHSFPSQSDGRQLSLMRARE